MAIEAGALRRLADPGPAGHAFAGTEGPQIVDLVPGDDPDVAVDMLGRRHRAPMGGRHVLDPPHPGSIVDMAERVDVRRLRGDPLLEGSHDTLGMPAASRVKATPARANSAAIAAFGSAAP